MLSQVWDFLRGEIHETLRFLFVSVRPRRGGETLIRYMDGAACIREADGSVLVRKRAAYWLLLGVIAAVVVPFPVLGIVQSDRAALSAGILILFLAMAITWEAMLAPMLRPPLHFNAETKILFVGYSPSAQQYPFTDFSHVAMHYRKTIFEGWVSMGIGLVHRSGKTILVGTMSGGSGGRKVLSDVTVVSQAIAALVGVRVELPTSG
jgi:hypothetical protein